MTSEQIPDRAHARQRLDEAWRVLGQVPADLQRAQVGFGELGEDPTTEERAALESSLDRVLRALAEGADALLAVRDWISTAQDDQPQQPKADEQEG